MTTRDYSNMPQLDLNDKAAIEKAKVQILHQEPLIMSIPDEIDLQLDWNNFNCEYDENADVHYNCDGGKAVFELANRVDHPEFSELADACNESSSLVDIDIRSHRLIFHD
ncbi:MAG: hypothetical protein PVF82_05645 [Gammaproteobacteria bacterium]